MLKNGEIRACRLGTTKLVFRSDLYNFGALIVDLGVGGGEEREEEEREDEHEDPVEGGGVGQPVHQPAHPNHFQPNMKHTRIMLCYSV